ncbi:MAG: GGDEF domain-containing protein [Sumerlaeia bacterium]
MSSIPSDHENDTGFPFPLSESADHSSAEKEATRSPLETTQGVANRTDMLDRRLVTRVPSTAHPSLLYPVFICLTGPGRGQRRVLDGKEVVLGRSSQVDWNLPDSSASRRHAKLTYVNQERPDQRPRCIIEDMGSRNGTEVNGHIIEGPYELQERDRILVGSTIIGYFVRDEAELNHDESLIASATRDCLTGLFNRRQLTRFLRYLLSQIQQSRGSAHFLLLDLDHFKTVNDRYGHDAGDKVLMYLADLLRQQCRTSDLVARWGGEEFAIVLPRTNYDEAKTCAQRIRKAVESSPVELDGVSISFTISIGGTELRPTDDVESMFVRADRMLYRAKARGRNRVDFTVPGETIDGTVTA